MQQKLRKRLKNERGLTLIELLAVIVILGIIAAIAVPSIGGIIQKSKEDAVKSDAITVINAAKMYVATNGVKADGTAEMDKTKLEEYLESVSLKENYKVEYAEKKYKITGEGLAGNKLIKFEGATVEDIDGDEEKGARTIPKP